MTKKNKTKILDNIENIIAFISLIGILFFLFIEIVLRQFKIGGIPKSYEYIKIFIIWLSFFGAIITTKKQKHLSISIISNLLHKEKYLNIVNCIISFISTTIVTVLSFSSFSFLLSFESSDTYGIIPAQIAFIVIPLGFLIMAIQFFIHSPDKLGYKLFVCLGFILGVFISLKEILFSLQIFSMILFPDNFKIFNNFEEMITISDKFYNPFINICFWPLLIILISSVFFGAPIFIVLGGIAVLLFAKQGSIGSISSIPIEIHRRLCQNEIPAIPLFTLAGFLLSSSKAGERFLRLLRAIFGWLPGSLAIMAVIISAFFTTFTGASGVTILALGSILFIAMTKRKYDKEFSYGLITSAGSIGLLFPPSLPLIMYGVAAMISIRELFVGGIIPGFVTIIALSIIGVFYAKKKKLERFPFIFKDTIKAIKESLWEILIPIIVLLSFLTGFTTLVETGAITVIYVLIIEVFIYKDIKLKNIPKIFSECFPIIGGILIIISMASGLNYYIIDAQIPELLSELCSTYIKSPIIFLILLNIGLLITGCFMDIFSAILVVAPLIIPLGDIYGINKIHLGIIFLANLQLGYLTPPVGLNLFIASYRFNWPLSKLSKNILPFFIILLISVLIITYVPILSTGLLEIFKFK